MIKLICILSFLWTSVNISAQTQNFWTKKADFAGLKRERAVAFTIANKGYIATGVDTAALTKKDLWEYDPGLNTWTQKADLPSTPRRNAVSFTIGNEGYIGTGIDSSAANSAQILADFWAYSPITNSWVEKASFPGSNGNGVYFATAFSTDNKGYVCGGKRGPNNYTAEFWEYKPFTDSWTQRADFPGGVRYQLCSFIVDNFAYVGLGIDNDIYRKDIWQYNPATNGWIQKNDFLGGERGGVCTFTLGQRGFICLGSNGGVKNDLWQYNPFTDNWSIRANFDGSARKNAIAFTVGNRAFVGTGKGISGKKLSFYEYNPFNLLSNNEVNSNLNISIYPNPAKDQLNLSSFESFDVQFQLFDTKGQLIISQDLPNGSFNINTSHISPGLYLAVLKDNNQNTILIKKIIFN